MNKKHLVVAILIAFVFISASGGVGDVQNRDRSGSPDGDSVCSLCHTSGSFSPEVNLTVSNSQGLPVTSYIPGEIYMLSYQVSETTGNPAEYGFQSTSLFTNNNNAGEFMNPGALTQIQTVSNNAVTNRKVVEHSFPSSSGIWEVEWVAPSEDLGDVTFFYSGIAANGNNHQLGDGYAGNTTTLMVDPTGVDDLDSYSEIQISTSSNGVLIDSKTTDHLASIEVYTITGELVAKDTFVNLPYTVQSSELARGIHIFNVDDGRQMHQLKTILK